LRAVAGSEVVIGAAEVAEGVVIAVLWVFEAIAALIALRGPAATFAALMEPITLL